MCALRSVIYVPLMASDYGDVVEHPARLRQKAAALRRLVAEDRPGLVSDELLALADEYEDMARRLQRVLEADETTGR